MKISFFLIFLLLPFTYLFANEDSPAPTREENKRTVAEIYENNIRQFQKNKNVLVLPGLVANRETGTVTFYAESTGIEENAPVEFFLIGEQSGHDYESIAVALTNPENIRKGLIFIGMPLGTGTDPRSLRFWPKGERVKVNMDDIRLESYILNSETGESLPANGLVFIGSKMVSSIDDNNEQILAVAHFDPFSIAANYNEPTSILDVPWQAPQASVYKCQSLHPDYILPEGQLLKVTMEPEYKGAKQRVKELDLFLSTQSNTSTQTLNNIRCRLVSASDRGKPTKYTFDDLLAEFSRLNDDGRDPFVTIHFDNQMPISMVKQVCLILKTIDTATGIRIEPPPLNHLYYKAFIPPEAYRIRKERLSQPPELHLTIEDDKTHVMLTEIEEIWKDGQIDPDLKTTDYEISSPDALATALKNIKTSIPAIIVYVDSRLTYGEIMQFIGKAMPTHPMVHVFQ